MDIGIEYQEYISVREFREFGFLQEVNRLFLHPLGLALAISVDDKTKEEKLCGVWDCRDDLAGVSYKEIDLDKASRVAKFARERIATRKAELGYVIQPAGSGLDWLVVDWLTHTSDNESELIEERLRSLGYME